MSVQLYKEMWQILWLTVVAAGPECPRFYCIPLESGTCARITNTEDKLVQLNNLGCGVFTGCDIWEIFDALDSNQNSTFPCTFYPPELFERGDTLLSCPQRKSQRNLKFGPHPRVCNSEQDCELEDGTFGECLCGLSRYKICQPDISDALYSNFWKICGESDNMITEEIDYIWGYYYWNYPLLVTAPICADEIIPQLWMKVITHADKLAMFAVLLGVVSL